MDEPTSRKARHCTIAKLACVTSVFCLFLQQPKDHKTIKAANFQPLEKELVFDIDMTDYDDVRGCCSLVFSSSCRNLYLANSAITV